MLAATMAGDDNDDGNENGSSSDWEPATTTNEKGALFSIFIRFYNLEHHCFKLFPPAMVQLFPPPLFLEHAQFFILVPLDYPVGYPPLIVTQLSI